MTKNGFLDSVSGNRSSARMIGVFCLIIVFTFCFMLIKKATTAIEAAGAIATVFTTIGTPVLIYLFKNKQTEVEHEEIKQQAEIALKEATQ